MGLLCVMGALQFVARFADDEDTHLWCKPQMTKLLWIPAQSRPTNLGAHYKSVECGVAQLSNKSDERSNIALIGLQEGGIVA